MRIHDWLIQPDTAPRELAPSPLRVQELLPADSIRIGPPGAEDKVEISAMACMLLEANARLEGAEESRIEQLRAEYLTGRWAPDTDGLARRMVGAMATPGIGEENSSVRGDGR